MQLSLEEKAMIPIYRKKWKDIAYSTEPIDREEAALAVKNAYAMIEKKEPKIIFFDSPFPALSNIGSRMVKELDFTNKLNLKTILTDKLRELNFTSKLPDKFIEVIEMSQYNKKSPRRLIEEELWSFDWNREYSRSGKTNDIFTWRSELWQELNKNMGKQLSHELEESLVVKLDWKIFSETEQHFMRIFRNYLQEEILPEISKNNKDMNLFFSLIFGLDRDNLELYGMANGHYCQTSLNRWIHNSWNSSAAFVDFCVSVLNCQVDETKWSLFQSLIKQCYWMFPLENICFVCDRPNIIAFDNQKRFHGENLPAIQYRDGSSIYAYHGVILPEKYGKLQPNQWRAQWLLEENNAELKRVLIQQIGYTKICQELQATELDNWQEYSLLKIDSHVDFDPMYLLQIDFHLDVDPMYLLKMTCPSTGHIHALRVPPTMKSAKEAITWVNWGISPEEFSVQT